MKHNVPEDFKRASEFEKELQKEYPWLWLNKEGIPLEEIDFDSMMKDFNGKREHVDEEKFQQFVILECVLFKKKIGPLTYW